MSAARDRILGLLSRGVIDAAEAERLLAALGPSGGPSRGSVLINPFLRLPPLVAIACGLLASGLGLLWGPRGLRFDGFLDLHVTAPAGLGITLRDQLAGWPLGVLVFYLASRLIARAPTRLIDVVGYVGLSRLPLAVVAPLALLITTNLRSPASILALTAISLALVLQLLWLFQGMRHAHGRRTVGATAAYLVGVVLSEVLSKLVVFPSA